MRNGKSRSALSFLLSSSGGSCPLILADTRKKPRNSRIRVRAAERRSGKKAQNKINDRSDDSGFTLFLLLKLRKFLVREGPGIFLFRFSGFSSMTVYPHLYLLPSGSCHPAADGSGKPPAFRSVRQETEFQHCAFTVFSPDDLVLLVIGEHDGHRFFTIKFSCCGQGVGLRIVISLQDSVLQDLVVLSPLKQADISRINLKGNCRNPRQLP